METLEEEIEERFMIRGEEEDLNKIIYPWKQSMTLIKLYQQ